jgi:hypothetical protein
MPLKLSSYSVLFSILFIATPASAAIRTVALSNQAAAGTPASAKFATFTPPVLDALGKAAFLGQLQTGVGGVNSSSDSGIWSESAGALSLVAREGQQAPGAPTDADFSAFSPLSVNADGELTFNASLVVGAGGVTASNNSAVWSSGGGSLAMVVRKGQAITGAATGLNIAITAASSLNRTGQVALRSPVIGGGSGIWKLVNGAMAPVIKSGDQAPGTDAGVTFTSFSAVAKLNSAGLTAFRGLLEGPGVSNETNGSGIWVERNNAVALVARRGNSAPIAGLKFLNIGEPTINQRGQTAFLAALTGPGVDATNNDALWAEKDNVLSLVARAGTQAPLAPVGAKFNAFGEPLFNGDSDVAFTASLVGGGLVATNDDGIWIRKDGVLKQVAAEGAAAPGGPQGALFQVFTDISLNSAGQVAFSSTLAGGLTTAESDKGIWAETFGGVLTLVAREGQAIEVAPGSTRTISTLSLASGTNEDGRGGAFNDRGELAFAATFTDGSSGVFISDVVKSMTGDFDGDLDVDGSDFLAWQRGFGNVGGGHPGNGDATADGNVNSADLDVWKMKFAVAPATSIAATVPEPGALALVAWLIPAFCRARRR